MRVFLAVLLPEALWAAVGRVQEDLGCGRAVADDALHLTLVFLGEVAERDLEAVHEALAALRIAPFEITLAGLDLIAGGDRSAALVLKVRPDPVLEAVQARLVQAVRRSGIDLERRRFRPHVTIARFPKGLSAVQAERVGRLLERQGDVVLPVWRVARVQLLRSHLTHQGAEYEILCDYPEG